MPKCSVCKSDVGKFDCDSCGADVCTNCMTGGICLFCLNGGGGNEDDDDDEDKEKEVHWTLPPLQGYMEKLFEPDLIGDAKQTLLYECVARAVLAFLGSVRY